MSIISDIRDEMELEMFKKLLTLVSENLETESVFLYAEPRTYFKMDAIEMIDFCSKLFGYNPETGGRMFNEIMEKKEYDENNC